MSDLRRDRSRGPLVGAGFAAAVIAIGIGVFITSRPPAALTPLDRSTAFWVAVSDGDLETAIEYLDPGQVENGLVNIFGRARTITGQFDWYEAVEFRWALDQCIETAEGAVECAVTGRNAWSDALGVAPVAGTYIMNISESGITDIVEKRESFRNQWLPQVYDIFNKWVVDNHPADAPIMWSESDITPEVLELFEINTERFVEAQTEG